MGQSSHLFISKQHLLKLNYAVNLNCLRESKQVKLLQMASALILKLVLLRRKWGSLLVLPVGLWELKQRVASHYVAKNCADCPHIDLYIIDIWLTVNFAKQLIYCFGCKEPIRSIETLFGHYTSLLIYSVQHSEVNNFNVTFVKLVFDAVFSVEWMALLVSKV